MRALHEIRTMDDLERTLEQLSSEVARMHVSGQPSFPDVQLTANALTRAELALNDLDRREACEGMPSREMAGRSVELRNRIRLVQHAVDRAVRRDEA
jgi:hypothetical protein